MDSVKLLSLKEFFPIQRELDEKYKNKLKKEGESTLVRKLVALSVELGELANEVPESFKYWSDKCIPKTEKVALYYSEYYQRPLHLETENARLEEFVDFLHFILSIGIELGVDESMTFYPTMQKDITHQFANLFVEIGELTNRVIQSKGVSEPTYIRVIELFFGLGLHMGYSFEDTWVAYRKKNKINHSRLNKGY